MSFYALWQEQDWQSVQQSVLDCTQGDVEQALQRQGKRTVEDFMALISPAADAYLEPLAQLSAQLTRRRFGHTMQLFIPLYLSNLCANDCSYCGFSMSNAIQRKTLNEQEVEAECRALKKQGFDSVLLVTGEHERKVGMAYFRTMLPVISRYFSHIAMEVQPLSEAEYAELRSLGVASVLVYQETYNEQVYAEHHLRGRKQDFKWRLQTPERIGQAGIDKIGLGALLGLTDWRTDSVATAMHLRYMQKHYWRSRYSVSFPRLRPCAGGVEVAAEVNDRQLVQLLCAFRLFDAELELSLSTRESAYFRDHAATLGATHFSAGSKTQPGGYADQAIALEQFSTEDNRSPLQVAEALQKQGLQPVWKDWELGLS
ncbi:2-iminoacetate synthase ThiH [Aliidiomarina minuta]|uniref:2-iminoacetate synthase ThiH n=1 Tax=Aliidiomarina minuta TaxID=880057 RepID=A0A432W3V9_9GAMM|nr:2-iminoacetate synthase ThiH [Aliidiomarina minuta]RUO23959.1 2-iminoacetate synthase ThiH [Aliidiomarina minuta]